MLGWANSERPRDSSAITDDEEEDFADSAADRAELDGGGAGLAPSPAPPSLFHPPLPSSPPRRGGGGGGGPPAGPNREVIMCGLTVPLIQVSCDRRLVQGGRVGRIRSMVWICGRIWIPSKGLPLLRRGAIFWVACIASVGIA